MDLNTLHRLIDIYEERIDKIYNTENYELFKWQATKTWQTEWNKPVNAFPTFADRFAAARKDFDVFIDGKIMHPSTGVMKLWQKEPDKVESLFREVLFAEDHGDVDMTQRNMDRFLDEYEAIRIQHFPRHFSYKIDRHAASVFLAVNSPEKQFVFKSSDAHMMAKYTDFGFSIGAGASFSLRNYYKLCEEIVKALHEHESLLEKHFSYFTDALYRDESLHLLAFDLMYCCRTYNYYGGIPLPPKNKKETAKRLALPSAEDLAAERAASLDAKSSELSILEFEIEELEAECEDLMIPLLNVQITSLEHGEGVVIEQNENIIAVQYPGKTIKMTLGSVPKTFRRPKFENDDEVWGTFSKYAAIKGTLSKHTAKREKLKKDIEILENELKRTTTVVE